MNKDEVKILSGISKVIQFLQNPDENVRFLDVTFCDGSCVGGPCVHSKLPLPLRKKRVLNYLKRARKEDIPEEKKGVIKKAKGVLFNANYSNT